MISGVIVGRTCQRTSAACRRGTGTATRMRRAGTAQSPPEHSGLFKHAIVAHVPPCHHAGARTTAFPRVPAPHRASIAGPLLRSSHVTPRALQLKLTPAVTKRAPTLQVRAAPFQA